jgi:tRNA dimethylallyltransferase
MSIRHTSRADPPNILLSREEALGKAKIFASQKQKPLIAITGPTASGKTALSIAFAKKMDGEIINADSKQFYRGMDIGTAKITKEEMQGIPHHCLDFLCPDEEYTVAEFQDKATKKIKQIFARKNIPFLVGGSGLFINALSKNFIIPRIPPQKEWRKRQEHISSQDLYNQLRKYAPERAKNIHPNNRSRVLRAIEICVMSGENRPEFQKTLPPEWETMIFVIWQEPEELRNTIQKRVNQIWSSGFLEEVQYLIDAGYDENTPAMIAHGYREMMQFLCGKLSEDDAKQQMIRNTQRYAKRQRTWWRKESNILWIRGE